MSRVFASRGIFKIMLNISQLTNGRVIFGERGKLRNKN